MDSRATNRQAFLRALALLAVVGAASTALLVGVSLARASGVPGATYTGIGDGGGSQAFEASAGATSAAAFKIQADHPAGEPVARVIAVSAAWGDVDCSGSVTIGDAQKISRSLIGLSATQAAGCPQIGSHVLADGVVRIWGDVDCSGVLNIGDAQKVSRFLIGASATQGPNCPRIGSGVSTEGTPTPTPTLAPTATPSPTPGGKGFGGGHGRVVAHACPTPSGPAVPSPCVLPPTGGAPLGRGGFPWAWVLVASAVASLGAAVALGMTLEARRRE